MSSQREFAMPLRIWLGCTGKIIEPQWVLFSHPETEEVGLNLLASIILYCSK